MTLTAKDAKSAKDVNARSHEVIGAAIEVHRELGPGLLESAYEQALAHELHTRGVPFQRQVAMPVAYKKIQLDCGFRLDMLVDDCLVTELKSVDKFAPIHEAQVWTYLRLSDCRLALLLNFNVTSMRNGIKRVARDL